MVVNQSMFPLVPNINQAYDHKHTHQSNQPQQNGDFLSQLLIIFQLAKALSLRIRQFLIHFYLSQTFLIFYLIKGMADRTLLRSTEGITHQYLQWLQYNWRLIIIQSKFGYAILPYFQRISNKDQQSTSQNSFLISINTPATINASPRQSVPEAQELVPKISTPDNTPITTDTLVDCINFIVIITVNNSTTPQNSITPHWSRDGTTIFEAGKKTGNPILHRKMNWWAIVQGLLLLNLKSSELTQPKISPGRNYHNLLIEQLFSIRSEPMMMEPKKTPQAPILLPLVSSQKMANIIPPDPFHPKCMLSSNPVSESTHSTLSRLSKVSTGRQGMSSCLRMIQVQLMTKAVRLVTKEYWIMGSAKQWATAMWRIMRRGARMMRVSLENLISGSPPNSLYSKSRGSTGWLCSQGLGVAMSSLEIKGVLSSLLIVNNYQINIKFQWHQQFSLNQQCVQTTFGIIYKHF